MADTTGKLDDKVVLITGAARGQGAAEARQAAEHGAIVAVCDIRDELGEAVAAEVDGSYYHLDVTSAGQWREVVAAVVETHGKIDGLVNNAGIYLGDTVLDANEDNFRRVVEVNQHGVYLGMTSVAPTMIEQGAGSIVNISSIAGMRGYGAIAYAASKWAVRGMTQSAAAMLGPHNVRVNSIHPGAIETDMLFDLGEAATERLVRSVPMGRSAKSEEVGAAVMFLLSDEASYMTGSELVVDGGLITR